MNTTPAIVDSAPVPPHVLAYYTAEQAICDEHATRVAPWTDGGASLAAHTQVWHAELERRSELRIAALKALRAADLEHEAACLSADPTKVDLIQSWLDLVVAYLPRPAVAAAVEALRLHPRNEATDIAGSP